MSGYSYLIGNIKEEQAKIAQALVDGHAVNFETYQRLVGQHQGLELALDLLNRMLQEEAGREV